MGPTPVPDSELHGTKKKKEEKKIAEMVEKVWEEFRVDRIEWADFLARAVDAVDGELARWDAHRGRAPPLVDAWRRPLSLELAELRTLRRNLCAAKGLLRRIDAAAARADGAGSAVARLAVAAVAASVWADLAANLLEVGIVATVANKKRPRPRPHPHPLVEDDSGTEEEEAMEADVEDEAPVLRYVLDRALVLDRACARALARRAGAGVPLVRGGGEVLQAGGVSLRLGRARDELRALDASGRLAGFVAARARPLQAALPAAAALAAVAAAGGAGALWRRRQEMWSAARGAAAAARNAFVRYVVEPLRDVWLVVRYNEDDALAVMPRRTLDADVEALADAIVAFAARADPAGAARGDAAAEVRELARAGVSDALSRAYAAALPHPLLGVTVGPLAEILLIQAQRFRVDFSRSLFAMDRLMRSNELNFKLMALSPALLAVLAGAALFLWSRGSAPRARFVRATDALLRVERVAALGLARPAASAPELAVEEEGDLLFALDRLAVVAAELGGGALAEAVGDMRRNLHAPLAVWAAAQRAHRLLTPLS